MCFVPSGSSGNFRSKQQPRGTVRSARHFGRKELTHDKFKDMIIRKHVRQHTSWTVRRQAGKCMRASLAIKAVAAMCLAISDQNNNRERLSGQQHLFSNDIRTWWDGSASTYNNATSLCFSFLSVCLESVMEIDLRKQGQSDAIATVFKSNLSKW